MLRSTYDILGYGIEAVDGDIGKVYDFLFDDHEWTVRHLVVDTGTWLPGRRVLVAPEALKGADWDEKMMAVDLTKEKIKNSPSIDEDKPVSRQQEIELYRYYAWQPYWGAGMGGLFVEPSGVTVPDDLNREVAKGDSRLRGVRYVKGYHIAAADGEAGHIEDFIVDDESWIIRYVVVDTRNWLPGKKVLMSPWWLKSIDWADRRATTDLDQDAIKKGPAYDPSSAVNREFEERLYDFHGRPRYWKE